VRLAVGFAPEGSVLIVEDPEAHLSAESRGEVMRALSSFKGTLILVTEDEGFQKIKKT